VPDQGAEPTNWELLRALESFKADVKTDIADVKTDLSLLGGRVVSVELYNSDNRGNTSRHERAEARITDIEKGSIEAEKLRRANRLTVSIAILSIVVTALGVLIKFVVP
jgi:hypothetical protein